MDEKIRNAFLKVRLKDSELKEIEQAVGDYGMDSTSQFVRCAVEYVLKERPVLGKSFAPESADRPA